MLSAFPSKITDSPNRTNKMRKPVLLWVLFIGFLPLSTTEVSTAPPYSDQETTPLPKQGTPEATPDSFTKIYTEKKIAPATAEALKTETTAPTSETQNATIANSEATNYPTKDVPISPIYSAEGSSISIKSTQGAISSMISSTSSGYTSSDQTSMMKPETPKVIAPKQSVTTAAVQTAKLSATTEMVPGVRNTSNLSETTKLATTANFVSTVKLSTTQHVPDIQTTTAKIYPPVVTKGRGTTRSKNLDDDGKKAVKHGKIVAGLIGGALILMMIGFLVILYKKHKLKKHQIATTEWAGPTPFLETGGNGANNGHVTLRSASRISLTSFLPVRLSKRLSLLAETPEEMQDMQEMTSGMTFAVTEDKNGTTNDQSFEKSIKEADENNSESLGKTEEVVLVDELKEKEGETGKEKLNGQAAMKDAVNGQSENGVTQPAPKEDASIESNSGNNEQMEKDGADNVA